MISSPKKNKCISFKIWYKFPSSPWFFFRAALTAYGSFLARGWVRTVSAGLYHSHSNTRSKLHLQPTPQLAANTGSLTYWVRPGIKSTWILVGFSWLSQDGNDSFLVLISKSNVFFLILAILYIYICYFTIYVFWKVTSNTLRKGINNDNA